MSIIIENPKINKVNSILKEIGLEKSLNESSIKKNNPFYVTVIGEFSTGKSSLLNKLLLENEVEKLEVSDIPCTNKITEIRKAEEQKTDDDWDISEVSVINNNFKVDNCVYSNDGLLNNNIIFIDTPGVSSINETHTDITYGFLPLSKALLLVLDAKKGTIPRSVVDFIKTKIFSVTKENTYIAVNFMDLINEGDRSKIEREFINRLNELGINSTKVFFISAKENIGINNLKSTIKEKLHNDVKSFYNEQIKLEIKSLIDEVETEIQVRIKSLQQDVKKNAEFKKEVEKEIIIIERESKELKETLHNEIKRYFDLKTVEICNGLKEINAKVQKKIKRLPFNDINVEQMSDGIQYNIKKYLDGLDREISDDLKEIITKCLTDFNKKLKLDLNNEFTFEIAFPIKTINLTSQIISFILFDLALPMGWIVALIGKTVGEKMTGFNLGNLLANLSKPYLYKKLDDIFKDITTNISEQLMSNIPKINGITDKEIQQVFDDKISAISKGKDQEIIESDDKRKAEEERLKKIMEELNSL